LRRNEETNPLVVLLAAPELMEDLPHFASAVKIAGNIPEALFVRCGIIGSLRQCFFVNVNGKPPHIAH